MPSPAQPTPPRAPHTHPGRAPAIVPPDLGLAEARRGGRKAPPAYPAASVTVAVVVLRRRGASPRPGAGAGAGSGAGPCGGRARAEEAVAVPGSPLAHEPRTPAPASDRWGGAGREGRRGWRGRKRWDGGKALSERRTRHEVGETRDEDSETKTSTVGAIAACFLFSGPLGLMLCRYAPTSSSSHLTFFV